MASLLHILTSSSFPSSPASAAEPAILFSSCRTLAAKSSRPQIRGKRDPASSSISTVLAVAIHHEDTCSRETTLLSVGSQNDTSWTRKLGGIVCGFCTAASIIAGDLLPAFAEDLPDVPAVATPYTKSADRMKMGLVKGRIQACPLDVNPNCVSTSSNNGGYSSPWIIPESSTSTAVKYCKHVMQKIETAILSTQKNAAILKIEEIPNGGTYLAAEADGFLGRDVMEFLIKEDVVTYRSMARKVVYLYPFTTPIGDFDGQQKRLKTLEEELGWGIPSFENTYYDPDVDTANDF